MTDTENICGEENADGSKCKREAGWGTDRDGGPCKDHAESYHDPKKLDEETKSTLIGAAQEGAFLKHCAMVAGITPRTLRNWLEWGEADEEAGVDSPCADLFFRFQRARGAGAVRRLKDVDSAFVLERSYEYTKTEKREHEHSGPSGGPIPLEINETVHTTGYSEGNGAPDGNADTDAEAEDGED